MPIAKNKKRLYVDLLHSEVQKVMEIRDRLEEGACIANSIAATLRMLIRKGIKSFEAETGERSGNA